MSYGVIWKDNHGNSDYYSSHKDLSSAIAVAEIQSQYKDETEGYEITEVTVIDERNNLPVWKSTDPPELKKYLELDHEQWQSLTHGHHAKSDKPSVYFDIDGTTAKWYTNAKGFSFEEMIDPVNHYFRDLEPIEVMKILAEHLQEQGIDVCIISAAYKDTLRDKWEWIDKNLSFIPKENICFAPIGSDKSKFVKGNAQISILIDDYNKNLEQWEGVPIKALNGINSHSDKFMEIDLQRHEVEYQEKKARMERSVERGEMPESCLEELSSQYTTTTVQSIKYVTGMIKDTLEQAVEMRSERHSPFKPKNKGIELA